MITDPIADMLIRIKNGYRAGLATVGVPYSKIKGELAAILEKNGYVQKVEKIEDGKKAQLEVTLAYKNNEPALTDVKRVSKPGLRRYVGYREIPLVAGGMGIAIVSTPQGLRVGTDARKEKLGGEMLCIIW